MSYRILMSLHRISIPNLPEDIHLKVWKLEEDLDFFKDQVQVIFHDQIFNRTQNTQKQKESLACRLLLCQGLKELNYPIEAISYSHSGKPFMKNGIHFSFSHTKEFVGCCLSKEKHIGLDVEQSNRNIEKIAPRFLSEKELETFNSHNLQMIAWCAKEAIYKALDCKGLSFRDEIQLDNKGEFILAKTNFQGQEVDLNIFFEQNEILTIAVAIVNHPTN